MWWRLFESQHGMRHEMWEKEMSPTAKRYKRKRKKERENKRKIRYKE
jgi:hypothetical protein